MTCGCPETYCAGVSTPGCELRPVRPVEPDTEHGGDL